MKLKFLFWCLLILLITTRLFSQGLTINNVNRFIVTNNSNLIISGNGKIYNIGTRTFDINSNVRFTGNNQQWIDGTDIITFGNVYIQNTSNGVALNNNTNIYGTLNLQLGHFDLKNFVCDLGTTGTVSNENENARIRATNNMWIEGGGTGTIQCTRNNPSGNVAGLGLNFTPSVALGNNTVIIRGCNALQGSGTYTANYSIFRWYRINPGSGTASPITVNNFYYWGGTGNPELNGHIESNLQMFQWVQYGMGNPQYWEPRITSVNTSSDFVNSTTTSSSISLNYILITLGSTTTPLPVELVNFKAQCIKNANLLSWQTLSESNNSGFNIEKSSDGNDWVVLGFVPGNGNSNITVNYSYTDPQPYNPITYYRLQQIDINGDAHYSNIISSQCHHSEYNEDFQISYQNEQLQISVTGKPESNYKIFIINAIGQSLHTKTFILNEQNEMVTITAPLAAGIYYITLISDNHIISKPLLVK